MQLPIPSLMATLRQQGIQLDEFDTKRAVALIVLPPAGESAWPTPILLVPVNDFGKFIAPLKPDRTGSEVTQVEIKGTPMWVRNVGGYAAFADNSHKESLVETLKLSEAVPEALAPWGATVAEHDFAAVILQPGIKLMSAQVQVGIRTMKSAMAQGGEPDETSGCGVRLVRETIPGRREGSLGRRVRRTS